MRELDSYELSEWFAYYAIEPFGQEYDNLLHANICGVIANSNRDPKTKPQPYKIRDFMLEFQSEKPEQTWEDQLRFVRMLNAAFSDSQGGK